MNEIMILGTFHMEAQNDVVNVNQTDKIVQHNDEIAKLVEALTKFKPTKIAVEYEKKYQSKLDALYKKYCDSGSDSTNEITQIAFRLGKKLSLPVIDAIDWMERGAAEYPCGAVQEFLAANQPDLENEINKYRSAAVDLEHETIKEIFMRLNSEQSIKDSLAYYMNYARIGSDEYFGNGWLIWWHQRNLNIFTNVSALAEGKDNERILLLIGAAHKGILDQFFRNGLAFDVVDVVPFLE